MPQSRINVPILSTDYSLYSPPAIPGLPWGMGQPVVFPFNNMASTRQEKTTIAIPATVDANTDYTVNVNGEVVTVKTAGATTQAQLASMMLAALRSRMELTRRLRITMSGSTITLESLNPGTAITVSAPSNNATINDLTVTPVEVSGDESIVPMGRFVGRKFDYQRRVAGTINSNSTNYGPGQDGFIVHGVTHTTQALERVGRGTEALSGYRPFDTMNVWVARGNAEGIWVETTPEGDITLDDSFDPSSLFIATSPGNEGKLTKDSTNYSGRPLNGRVEVLRDVVKVFDWHIALISFDRLSGL